MIRGLILALFSFQSKDEQNGAPSSVPIPKPSCDSLHGFCLVNTERWTEFWSEWCTKSHIPTKGQSIFSYFIALDRVLVLCAPKTEPSYLPCSRSKPSDDHDVSPDPFLAQDCPHCTKGIQVSGQVFCQMLNPALILVMIRVKQQVPFLAQNRVLYQVSIQSFERSHHAHPVLNLTLFLVLIGVADLVISLSQNTHPKSQAKSFAEYCI